MSAARSRARGQVEHAEQCLLMRWVELAAIRAPEMHMIYAIPNGGQRHAAVAAKLRAEGVKAGIPDLCLPVARGAYHGLYLELKPPVERAGRKREPSPLQARWLEALREQGYRAELCYGWEHARATIEQYLSLPKPAGV